MQSISKLFIKGMVCQRCIHVIKSELEQIGITTVKVDLGEVTVISSNTPAEKKLIEDKINPLGFKLLEDKKLKTVTEIKDLIAQVYSGDYDFPSHFRFSDLVVAQQRKEYDSLSALFSLLEHKTIERYIIDYRIEEIEEFLVYSALTLSDIAFKLNYSSVAHLSKQFKQVTGLTPSHFKEIKKAKIKIEFSSN